MSDTPADTLAHTPADTLADTTERLIAAIEAETAALAALDLTEATARAALKQTAFEAFDRARAAARTRPPAPAEVARLRALAPRLEATATENRVKLEHAIAVQGEVIATLVRALARTQPANGGSAYGARGGTVRAAGGALTLSASA